MAGIFSKQIIFCNCCGKKMDIEYIALLGRNFKVCSYECLKEINWRETLSNMGKEYYEQKA